MAYLGCKYGGDLSLFKDKDLENAIEMDNDIEERDI